MSTVATSTVAPPGGTAERPDSAPAAKLTFLPDILEEHLEELGFLWGQRQAALRSADYRFGHFVALEGRIAAHLRGVRVGGGRGLAWIEAGLASDDALEAFASGFGLLHLDDATLLERVVDAFETADAPRRDGLRHALRHGPARCALSRLDLLARHAPAPLAPAAAEIRAFHGELDFPLDRLHAFLFADDAAVRVAGWRLVAYLIPPVEPKAYALGVDDEDAAVRSAALVAGAWCAQAGVLARTRALAAAPSPDHLDALRLLAVLGTAADACVLDDIVQSGVLGADGPPLLASLGQPSVVGTILREMENADPTVAAAAGAAFTRMTGVDVTSTTMAGAAGGSGEADAPDAGLDETVALPDAERARRHWRARPELAAAVRIAQGYDLGRELTRETFGALDMASRWETCLRGRFYGAWSGSPLWLEAFPQPR